MRCPSAGGGHGRGGINYSKRMPRRLFDEDTGRLCGFLDGPVTELSQVTT